MKVNSMNIFMYGKSGETKQPIVLNQRDLLFIKLTIGCVLVLALVIASIFTFKYTRVKNELAAIEKYVAVHETQQRAIGLVEKDISEIEDTIVKIAAKVENINKLEDKISVSTD